MTEWILSSSVLILVVLGLRAVLKDRISQRLRYGLWALVLIRLLIPFHFAESELSIQNTPPAQAVAQVQNRTETPITYVDYELPELEEPVPDVNLPAEEQQVKYEQEMSHYTAAIEQAKAETGRPITVAQILTAVWIAGMALTGLILLGCNLRFYIQLRLDRQKTDIPCELPVYTTQVISTPCLFGSAIYLPRSEAGSLALHHVLAHELGHYRQLDQVWSTLRCACMVLHWYNPLVWLCASLSKKDAELACDEATIKTLGEDQRLSYGKTLIEMTCAKREAKDLLLTATTMSLGKKALKERVQMIAKHPKTAVYTLIALILVTSLAVGCTFTGTASKDDTTADPPNTTADTTPDETTVPDDTTAPEDGTINSLYFSRKHYTFEEITVDMLPGGYEAAEPAKIAHLPAGTVVYANERIPEFIYIQDPGSDTYRKFGGTEAISRWENEENRLTDPFVHSDPMVLTYRNITYVSAVYDDDGGGIVPVDYEYVGNLEQYIELYDKPNNYWIDLYLRDVSTGISYRLTPAEPFTVEKNPIEHFQQLLSNWDEPWYNQATTSLYASPEEIDLYEFFYNGIRGESQKPTAEEEAFLQTQWPQFALELDLIRLPVEKMNAILRQYFGMELEDFNGAGMEKLVYWSETDAYYDSHGDANVTFEFTITNVTVTADGAYQVYYYTYEKNTSFVLTLMPNGDGSYRILSHLLA